MEHDGSPPAPPERGVVLGREEEAALVQRLAEAEESEKAGQLVPWEELRAARGM
jgi:hypothetical protein